MSNDLSVIDIDELNALAAATGANADDLQGGGNYLPSLKINYDEENDAGVELKKGTLYLTQQDVTVYGKAAKIRPLQQYFQYTQYSSELRKTLNRTIFITSLLTDEARDEKGTIKCGKPTSKELKENPELAKQFEDVKCYRHVYALVSYEGFDANGEPHTVSDVLATIRLKGSNFMQFHDEFIVRMPRNSKLWDWEAIIGVSKEKDQDRGAIYYNMHFDGDFSRPLRMTTPILETIKAIKANIDDINRGIDAKYYKALSSTNEDKAAAEALDITPSELEKDFADTDIPF